MDNHIVTSPPKPASGCDGGADPASGGMACGWARRARVWARRLIHGFSFFIFLFDLSWRASNRLGIDPIYRDLLTEAIAMPASVNRFCPPR